MLGLLLSFFSAQKLLVRPFSCRKRRLIQFAEVAVGPFFSTKTAGAFVLKPCAVLVALFLSQKAGYSLMLGGFFQHKNCWSFCVETLCRASGLFQTARGCFPA